jgi:hypothetical protein
MASLETCVSNDKCLEMCPLALLLPSKHGGATTKSHKNMFGPHLSYSIEQSKETMKYLIDHVCIQISILDASI